MATDNKSVEVVSAYTRIPYALIKEEIDGSPRDLFMEFKNIMGFYKVYKEGATFVPEGTAGDYIANLDRYKITAGLINKEARFLFGETPDVKVQSNDAATKGTLANIQEMQAVLDEILTKNMFSRMLVQGARDCFIGKRIAWVVNFNEESGVTVTFLNSLNFVYEHDDFDKSKLRKFVAFITTKESSISSQRRIFKKKYEMVDGICWLEESMYDGGGRLVEMVTESQETLLKEIPAGVVLNDGLTGDNEGQSEIEDLAYHETTFSKLSNADIDSERKGMNPIKYTIDMTQTSTKKLPTSAGSYWDLQSDKDINEGTQGKVGLLESSMGYSQALDGTLARVKTAMYEMVEMPNVSVETMQGIITSGKALKAVYWPLIVRCKEKMKSWAPSLQRMVKVIFDGLLAYPNVLKVEAPDRQITAVAYNVLIDVNYPLPEDELEERAADLSDVQALTMSKKSYMKKWRGLSDEVADAEIEQMALERQKLEDNAMPPTGGTAGKFGEGEGDDEGVI